MTAVRQHEKCRGRVVIPLPADKHAGEKNGVQGFNMVDVGDLTDLTGLQKGLNHFVDPVVS